MRETGQEKLTLEERIARSAQSQASSPEAAFRLVEKLSQLHTSHIFHGSADFERMYGLIGPYMDRVGDELLYYAGFCRSINLAFAEGAPQGGAGPTLGTRAGSAVVLLGLMLLDHARGRGRDREVRRCTRMTLGQYLDALEAAAFPEGGDTARKFRHWREEFLKFFPPSAPLADVLADLLRLYIHGWKVFDCLDHVLRCMEDLSRCLEGEGREQYPDPCGHFLDLAVSYSWDLPDPAGEGVSAGEVREQIFLPDRDFSPASLEAMAGNAPSPEFRELLERLLSERRLSAAMSEVNEAVSNLFMLWVGPYLWMGRRPQWQGSSI